MTGRNLKALREIQERIKKGLSLKMSVVENDKKKKGWRRGRGIEEVEYE